MLHTRGSTHTGPHWPTLAHTGPHWTTLAHTGPHGPLAHTSPHWGKGSTRTPFREVPQHATITSLSLSPSLHVCCSLSHYRDVPLQGCPITGMSHYRDVPLQGCPTPQGCPTTGMSHTTGRRCATPSCARWPSLAPRGAKVAKAGTLCTPYGPPMDPLWTPYGPYEPPAPRGERQVGLV